MTEDNNVESGGNSTEGDPQEKTACDFCYKSCPNSEISIVYTVMKGVEQKERVCSDCESEARRYEKPAKVGEKE